MGSRLVAAFTMRHSTCVIRIVRQLHHIKESAGRFIAPDVQHLNQAGVGAGNRFELNDATKLAFIGTVTGEAGAGHHLYRAPLARDAACQPDFPVASSADAANQLMIRHAGRSQ
jgi:hypothetical protein